MQSNRVSRVLEFEQKELKGCKHLQMDEFESMTFDNDYSIQNVKIL